MRELAKRWRYTSGWVGQPVWVLRLAGDPLSARKNRAFISSPDDIGLQTLYIWEPPYWVAHCEAKNLRALKTIGRLEAARILNG